MKRSETKISHKFPQFLLRNFGIKKDNEKDEYFLYVFDKNKQSSYHSSVERAFAEKNFTNRY
jgi:hypothetical protein